MSNIKKYIIDYDWKASIEIEIDHDVMTEEKLHQINNFWSDSEYRLNKHGSVLNAVLIMLAQHALLIAISSDLNAYGVVSSTGMMEVVRKDGLQWMVAKE